MCLDYNHVQDVMYMVYLIGPAVAISLVTECLFKVSVILSYIVSLSFHSLLCDSAHYKYKNLNLSYITVTTKEQVTKKRIKNDA